jgi:hypothetical protein
MTDWRGDLKGFFERTDKAREEEKEAPRLARFITKVAIPALQQVKEEMAKHGREVTVRATESSATVIVSHRGEEEMMYRIQGRTFPHDVLPFAEIRFRERKGLRFITVESMFRVGSNTYRLDDITPEEIIRNFIVNYVRRVEKD